MLVAGKSIGDVVDMSVGRAADFFASIPLRAQGGSGPGLDADIAGPILKEVCDRLRFLCDVGLDYLTLGRGASSLSGGEMQRIRLATQIGSRLVGVLYILDEPSIGLHQRDNERLLGTLRGLRDLGNSVIVVEHDEDTIRAADHVIDLGPRAGRFGGEVVAEGTIDRILEHPTSLTARYLRDELRIKVPAGRRARDDRPRAARRGSAGQQPEERHGGVSAGDVRRGHRRVGLGQVDARHRHPVPVAGASFLPGARHSGRAHPHRRPAPARQGHRRRPESRSAGRRAATRPPIPGCSRRSARSSPGCPEAKLRGYGPGRFSFNVKGGRCEACEGDGLVKIEMHFLPDVYVPCEVCKGRRYNRETLEVRYKGKSIADVLDLTVSDALDFFSAQRRIAERLELLNDVGLGYIHLGQAATTLSGGEAQRVKLATELAKRDSGPHALHPRRAHHRPALRGRPAPARGAAPPRGQGQQRHRHRAQPRRHQDGGLGRRPRPRRRRGRRADRRRRHARGRGERVQAASPASTCGASSRGRAASR